MANAGDLRLARPQGGMIDLRKNLQSSSDGITKLYKTFINSLYNLTGTNGYIWSAHISMIVLYLLITTPPIYRYTQIGNIFKIY